MNKAIQEIIDDCRNGKEVEISEDLLIEFFPVMNVFPIDKMNIRREMRNHMKQWLEKTEALFGIEWVLIGRDYRFRALVK